MTDIATLNFQGVQEHMDQLMSYFGQYESIDTMVENIDELINPFRERIYSGQK